MPMEKTMLDRLVQGAFMGKRAIGRPVKYNVRNRGMQGWIELCFSPRNKVEEYLSSVIKFVHPYLFFVTYRFHVEKAREGGFRIEDTYHNKFHKEPYIMHHLYAQYFHPTTLLERVRDVRFYRQPRTLFKGFTVPDWARAPAQHGWETDVYSRAAWDNAMHDLHSEWTPMQFVGDRNEPNPLQWLRWEQFGNGFGARLFYNEKPQPLWWRHGGHMLENPDSDKERDRVLHSFTYGDQGRQVVFGMDTSTPEGREAFQKEYEILCELAPEVMKKENMVFPHEMAPKISTEPHFRRVWQYYREHSLRLRLAAAIENGDISQEDANAMSRFVGLSGTPSFNIYILARTGKLDHLDGEPSFQATMRVMNALGFESIEFDDKTAMPMEEQFWEQFDGIYRLTEDGMKAELPNMITDPQNRVAVQALLAERGDAQAIADDLSDYGLI